MHLLFTVSGLDLPLAQSFLLPHSFSLTLDIPPHLFFSLSFTRSLPTSPSPTHTYSSFTPAVLFHTRSLSALSLSTRSLSLIRGLCLTRCLTCCLTCCPTRCLHDSIVVFFCLPLVVPRTCSLSLALSLSLSHTHNLILTLTHSLSVSVTRSPSDCCLSRVTRNNDLSLTHSLVLSLSHSLIYLSLSLLLSFASSPAHFLLACLVLNH